MKQKNCILVVMALSIIVLAIAAPVDVFMISDGEKNIYSRPAPVGCRFMTRYIHSVEKTSVEDDYRIVGERIWSWEERVLSQNAGMPTERPRNGRLIMDGEWLRFRGGRFSWSELFYRVGNDTFGMNELIAFSPYSGHYLLFKLLPSRRLRFTVLKTPFILAFIHGRGL
ncbi:MAG: DUF1850 domain-containing protein [Thermovirgaceae bacterium]|nr:DUF1850 domain-containing protein [Thermovirgaceae bacterium]